MFNGREAGRGERHPVRGGLRDSAGQGFRREIAVLLLALVQLGPVRPASGPHEDHV